MATEQQFYKGQKVKFSLCKSMPIFGEVVSYNPGEYYNTYIAITEHTDWGNNIACKQSELSLNHNDAGETA